jgi:hypothetical protein
VQQQTQYITVQAKLPDQELPVMLEVWHVSYCMHAYATIAAALFP